MVMKHARAVLALIVLLVVAGDRARAAVPATLTHQGVISVHGERFSGTGNFYFALIGSATSANLWTHDGTQLGAAARPDNPIALTVINGVYTVALGVTPTPPVPSQAFESDDVLLRIWFDDGAGNGVFQLSPDVALASVPYVFRALDSDRAAEADNATTVGGFLPRELTPAGAMFAFGGATAPSGWLLCDGSAVSRADFADLFAAIGTAYGFGDDKTTFHLPDLRGRFVRGVSGASGNDPNANQRTASNAEGNTGNNVGSLQADATSRPNSNFITATQANHVHSISSVSSHTHSVGNNSHRHSSGMRASAATGGFPGLPRAGTGSFLGAYFTDFTNHSHSMGSAGGHAHSAGSGGGHGHSINSGGDAETRPTNVYVNWIIKH